MDWPGFLSGIFGGVLSSSVVVYGMSRWLGDVWLGRILAKEKAKYEKELEGVRAEYAQELEKFKAELDRSVFVTRAQFETEFAAYKQAFEALAQVRLAMASMRPEMSLAPRGETDEDRRNKLLVRLRELIDAQNKAVAVVENLSPFYPADIYTRIVDGCLRASALEIVDIQTAGDDTFSITWYQEGARRMEQFMSAYNAVSSMIRNRIATLTILPPR